MATGGIAPRTGPRTSPLGSGQAALAHPGLAGLCYSLCSPTSRVERAHLSSSSRWLTQKGARQKKINEWLGIKNETEE